MSDNLSMDSHSEDGDRPHNRLLKEKSPYLLQHAYNPVDWYPWGEEAFAKAAAEDRPIFLSIGYSTCHWCHVMERESFEDAEVARLMNDFFISIKVDREERPDIDNIYMKAAQMMTGRGGWPLTIVMSADKRPFFAGTYFPKEGRFGQVGMVDLIPRLKDIWQNHRDKVTESAAGVVEALRTAPAASPGAELDINILQSAYNQLSETFDADKGGFGNAPKFPTPHNLTFLLRYWRRGGNPNALKMVEETLRAMRRGGIYDHIGFGFHRYSTDREWLVPHFEKMLYDQALLAIAYLEAFQVTSKAEFAETTKEIFTYVLRDMTDSDGGFYSAEDADSPGGEGKFYLWSRAEVEEALSSEDAETALKVFNINYQGNFQDQLSQGFTGENIPHLTKVPAELARELHISEIELQRQLKTIRAQLFKDREQRPRPHKDDKILADWNGLMVAALARGSQVLGEPKYAKAAARAVDFIFTNMRDGGGRLLHRYRDGEALLPAYLSDYAFLVWGLIELYEATFEVNYLKQALELNEIMLDLFWDDENGGFYLAVDDSQDLFHRPKEIYDGALPSGNSVAALNLLRLGRLAAQPELEAKAAALERYFAGNISRMPVAHTQMLAAVDFGLGPDYEVVIVSSSYSQETKAMLAAVNSKFIPNKVVLLRDESQAPPPIDEVAQFARDYKSVDGKATAYICQNYACRKPVTDVGELLKMLE